MRIQKPARAHEQNTNGRRVALVTEELSAGGCSGGIGGAFHELALALVRAGHHVDILFVPSGGTPDLHARLKIAYGAHGISVLTTDPGAVAWGDAGAEQRSYAIFRFLRAAAVPYDFVHFHDYKGLGFYSLAAKRQALGFASTHFVVQAHGPTRWTLEANGNPFTTPDQLRVDFMERECVAHADILVSPSQYLLDWFAAHDWPTPAETHVVQNICLRLRGAALPHGAPPPIDELVFYARHEERKGLIPFCDAIDQLEPFLAERGIRVTFLGRFGEINAAPSALFLARRAASWRCAIEILPDHNRDQAASVLAARPGALIVIPSPVENSPYTVLEAVMLGRRLVTSADGGARELLDAETARHATCQIAGPSLAAKLRHAIDHGVPVPQLRIAPEMTERAWLALHARAAPTPAAPRDPLPRVTAAIVHHERPAKLIEALLSLAAQTYPNLDILVVDDGSRRPDTLRCLERMTPLMERAGARLIRQDNLYLGAARNRAARESAGDYLIFLDDDDIAFPTMVQTLVTAARATGAAVVNCLNLFMEESRRAEAFPFPDRFRQKVSYLPLGGPLTLAPWENCFGAATALLRRDAFERVGGYTELHGVGHEDYELYTRLLQAGERIEIVPLPLYLYEVGRPSMVSNTSRYRNFQRVVDGIDPGAYGPARLRDLASLIAGQRARDHNENYRPYGIATSDQPELLAEIFNGNPRSAEFAARVAEYARRIGARQFAASMHAVENSRRHAASLAPPPVLPVAPPAVAPAPAAACSEFVDALVDLAYGRVAEAIARCAVALDRDGKITPALLRCLGGIADSRPRPAELREITAAMRAMPVAERDIAAAAPILFRIALAASDAPLAAAIVLRLQEAEEREYLAAYPDVANAVSSGAFATGLAHYASHRREGREGFAGMQALCDILFRQSHTDVRPEQLRDVLADRAGPMAKAA